jgi:hypothetical protein
VWGEALSPPSSREFASRGTPLLTFIVISSFSSFLLFVFFGTSDGVVASSLIASVRVTTGLISHGITCDAHQERSSAALE